MASTIARPRPVPPRERARSPRVKRSKAWPFSAGSNPGRGRARAGARRRRRARPPAPRHPRRGAERCRRDSRAPARRAGGPRAAPRPSELRHLQLAAGLRRPGVEAARGGGEQLGGIELLRPDGQPALVGAGQHEQVLRELDEPVALGGGRRHGLAQLLRRAALAERQLELRPQERQRRAQLVARARHEAALALGRALEPVEHLVQRVAELSELVTALRHGKPAAASQPRDLRGLRAHRAHRPQRRGRDPVGRERGQQRERSGARSGAPPSASRAPPRGPRAWRPRRRRG